MKGEILTMKFYCVEDEVVYDEREQREEYESVYKFDGYAYDDFLLDILHGDPRSVITEEIDTGRIARNAALVSEWAKDFCGLGGAAGKPDVEQFKYLRALDAFLSDVVKVQELEEA